MQDFKKFFNENKDWIDFGRFTKSLRNKYDPLIQEGLITSYPVNNVLSMLGKKYKNITSYIQSDPFHKDSETAGISLYLKTSEINDNIINDLKRDLNVYGYFIALQDKYNDKETSFFIEPKYSFLVDKKYLKNKRCFHITHEKYLDKIFKIGLIPRNSQTHFSFNGERIYLMFSDNDYVIRKFGNVLAKSKNWEPSDLRLLEIFNHDTLDVYLDINFENIPRNIATFTFDNIYPENVKILD